MPCFPCVLGHFILDNHTGNDSCKSRGINCRNFAEFQLTIVGFLAFLGTFRDCVGTGELHGAARGLLFQPGREAQSRCQSDRQSDRQSDPKRHESSGFTVLRSAPAPSLARWSVFWHMLPMHFGFLCELYVAKDQVVPCCSMLFHVVPILPWSWVAARRCFVYFV